jgi:hypothetical protein
MWFKKNKTRFLIIGLVVLCLTLGTFAILPVSASPSTYSYAVTTPSLNWNSPANSTTYYTGLNAPTTLADSHRIYFPASGTLSAVYISAYNAGVQATSEPFSVYIRINNTTDVLVTSLATADAAPHGYNIWSNTGLSQAISQGDYFEVKIVTPNWTTKPTTLYMQASLSITP